MNIGICDDRVRSKLAPELGRMSGHPDIDSLQLIGVGISAVLALHQAQL